MARKRQYRSVGSCMFKKRVVIVSRDQYGKFYVDVNARETQKRLKAEEIVRYLLNMMEGA